jgi:hypothetical protein
MTGYLHTAPSFVSKLTARREERQKKVTHFYLFFGRTEIQSVRCIVNRQNSGYQTVSRTTARHVKT